MAPAVMERDRISELAETDEIKELRKCCRQDNESIYANRGIESLVYMLSGICGQNVYENKIWQIYFEILDTRDFLKEKYEELSYIEAAGIKQDVEEILEEAEETLNLILECL